MMIDRTLFILTDVPITLATLLTVGATVITTLLVARVVRRLVLHHLKKEHDDDPDSLKLYASLGQLLVWFIGLDMALHLLGIRLTSILAASGFLSIAVGFAAKNLIENFLAGLILRWEKTIRPGDVVRLDDDIRVIKRIGIRATEAKTRIGEDVLIPNSLLTLSPVQNLTRQDRAIRIEITVGVAYESDLAVVKQTLQDIVHGLAWKSPDHQSWVLLDDFGDSAVIYRIMVWIDDVIESHARKAELLETIWWAFKERHIAIAYPQMDLHIKGEVSKPGP